MESSYRPTLSHKILISPSYLATERALHHYDEILVSVPTQVWWERQQLVMECDGAILPNSRAKLKKTKVQTNPNRMVWFGFLVVLFGSGFKISETS